MASFLPDWKKWSSRRPFSIALQTHNAKFNWREVNRFIENQASSLSSQGVTHSCLVTLVGKNSIDLVILYMACLELGAKCSILAPQPLAVLKDKLATLYKDAERPFVWVSPSGLESMTPTEQDEFNASVINLALHPAQVDRRPAKSCYLSQHIASLIFTSGSSGRPKAVAHTVSQHTASAEGLLERIPFCFGDSWLLSLPMYHVSGLSIVHRWLAAGACMKIGTGDLHRDIKGVTHASLVATQLQRLLAKQQPLNLKLVLLGGSHIPYSLSQQAAQKKIETWVGYGMTEAASTVTAKPIDESDTAGTILPNRELKIENHTVYQAGKTLACGYYYQGEMTPLLDKNGWFNTQDIGEWVGNEVRILGRKGNMFISGGENIHCEEIELVLNRHPQITQSMVVPIEDEEFGTASIGLIASQSDIDSLNLLSWLEGKIERFKRPKAFHILPANLLSTGIKISRKQVKDYVTAHFTNYRVI